MKTILLAVLLTGCSLYADDPSPGPDAAGHAAQCLAAPTYREIECLKMCTAELGLCSGADERACQVDCERYVEGGRNYCPEM